MTEQEREVVAACVDALREIIDYAESHARPDARAALAAIRERLDRCACEGACAVGAEVREMIDKEGR